MAEQIAEGKEFYTKQQETGNYHVHPEGFLYRFITPGQTGAGASNNSTTKPGPTEKVEVHYEGKLINGKIFDSSYARNETIKFGLNQVIKGWGLAVQEMSAGDVIECILPQELAYGMRGAGEDIPGGATLIFKIELFATKLSEAAKAGKVYYDEQKATGEYIEHPDGYLYKWLSAPPASDAPKPTSTDLVNAHYTGTTIDGNVFDSSVARGKPSEFGLNQVIPGWTSACQLMTTDSKIRVILPADLAYGEKSPTPKIPADSTLIFEIELFSWKKNPQADCNIM